MLKKTLYLHIGYPKTGTTTLQERMFPNHSELFYLRNSKSKLSFISDVFYARENSIVNNLDKYKMEFKDILSESSEGKIVYSEESITSFSMFFRFVPSPSISTLEPNSIARKLKTILVDTGIFDDVKIIITLRKQDDLMKSMYAQAYNLVFKRFKETRDFEKFLDYSINSNWNNFIVDAMDYNQVVKQYENLFGRHNICVLVFEELKTNKIKFVNNLCEFMNIDSNEALSLIDDKVLNSKSGIENSSSSYSTDNRTLLEIMSVIKSKYFSSLKLSNKNTHLKQFLNKIKIKGKNINDLSINEFYQSKLSARYSEGNKDISNRYNLELDKYGYYYDK